MNEKELKELQNKIADAYFNDHTLNPDIYVGIWSAIKYFLEFYDIKEKP